MNRLLDFSSEDEHTVNKVPINVPMAYDIKFGLGMNHMVIILTRMYINWEYHLQTEKL